LGFERAALGRKPKDGFNVVVASVSRHPDTAPDIGTFNYQRINGTQPPRVGPDKRAPKVLAFDSSAVHGQLAKLDLLGARRARPDEADHPHLRGRRIVKTIWTPLADANPFGLSQTTWRVPTNVRGHLRFSVRSIDAAGNRSALASAALIVR
jgi:hypothetical protein